MKVPFLDLISMHQEIMDETLSAMERVVRQSAFILGSDVEAFESDFAAYSEAKYAVGVDNGLSALQLILLAYDLEPGDEVLIPANTFIATAAAAVFGGFKPVFVDVVPNTYLMDPDKMEAALTPRTRAIMPVHLYGCPADMDPIMAFANKHNLVVVEDASQAHGARYKGKRVGSIGHAAGFSLYPGKNLGAYGDAGVLTTNDENVVKKVKAMRNCGQIQKYDHSYHPYNHRLDTIQAAILQPKLRKLDGWNDMRRQVAGWYIENLQGSGVVLPQTPSHLEQVWHLFVIQTDKRDEMRNYLGENGIGTAIHYPVPVHLSPIYKHMGYKVGDFPITEAEAHRLLSLPMFPHMTREQVDYVCDTVIAFENQHSLVNA